MRNIEINGKEYEVPEVDFNAICDLADLGVDVVDTENFGKNPLKMARGIVAWITGTDLKTAGNLVGEHVANGYPIDDIYTVFTDAITDSGFFKALQARAVVTKQPTDHQKKSRKASEA